MEGQSGIPQVTVKREEQSNSVILTYFQGDINSMVDQHFNRALSKASNNKVPSGKSKKIRKVVKSESVSPSCQWGVQSPSWSDGHFNSVSSRLQLNSTKESIHPPSLGSQEHGSSWAFPPMQHDGMGLPTMTYPHAMTHESLGITGQQYSNSLLNLLHGDRSEVAASMASGSKPELLPNWGGQPGFRDPMNPDTGIVLDKKDLYWY
ncbi:hypothetical protein UPYG_G00216060 [Umbra pygmaea]|uniref:Uncharacterized protein n=1 Tax=Umbra pygmaea TaxID=75934 RepID=A0ABD0X4W0_UMBPY